jgi:DNA-binding NarL/FixJ family response regulator
MRIVIAEDSALLREGLIVLLERVGHEIVGTAADAPELLTAVDRAIASQSPPDLVITDVRMPPSHTDDGLRAALDIRRRHPGVPVMVLSQYVADAYVHDLIEDARGGVGYLLKDRVGKVASFLRSIETVADGGVVVDPEVVRHLSGRRRAVSPLDRLTERERTVLGLMAEGESNTTIAQNLHLSEAAVAKHVGNIFAKLDLPPQDTNRRVRAVLTYLRESTL